MMRASLWMRPRGFSTSSMYLKSIDSKQNQTVGEIRQLSSNVSDMLDSKFQKLENEMFKMEIWGQQDPAESMYMISTEEDRLVFALQLPVLFFNLLSTS